MKLRLIACLLLFASLPGYAQRQNTTSSEAQAKATTATAGQACAPRGAIRANGATLLWCPRSGSQVWTGVSNGGVVAGSFTTNIPFNQTYTYIGQQSVSGALTFTKNTSGAIPGAQSVVRLVANGVHGITYSAFKETIGSAGYDNRSGIVNVLAFFFDGVDYWLTIYQELNASPLDVTSPTLSAAAVQNSAPTQIVLTYNESLDTGSVPSTGAFTVSGGKTVTGVAVSGSAVTVTVNSAYAFGDTITISYTPGASPIQDVAGNDAASLSSQGVTNNIAAPAAALAFTGLSNVTDNSDGTYTATSGTNAYMRGAKKLSGDGQIIWDVLLGQSGVGTAFVALDASNAITSFASADYGANVSAGKYAHYTSGTGVETATSATAGHFNRLRRTGATIDLEHSADGVSWTSVKTWTSVPAGDLFVFVQFFVAGASNTSGRLNNPKHIGGVDP